MAREIISTDQAPGAVGTYSQAVKCGKTVYLSGQIPLEPKSMALVAGDIDAQADQVFRNLAAVAKAAGGSLDDVVKVTIFLTDLTHFPRVNEVMSRNFKAPYPARATVQISALPKGALIEADAILVLP